MAKPSVTSHRIALELVRTSSAKLHRQTQFLLLLLGCVGVTGTALALALTLAHRLGRSWGGG